MKRSRRGCSASPTPSCATATPRRTRCTTRSCASASRAGQFDPARGAAAAWLAGIVRHAALDLARRRGRELPSDDPALGDAAVAPDALERVAASADGRRLRECLEALEEKNRNGILLAFVHGLSHSQVADRLGLPLGTVKAWIRRGLLQLKDC